MTKGERLKSLRISNNYTLEEIGKKINVARQTYFKYENNIITNIPTDKIELLAKIYGVSAAYIMGWDIKEKNMESNEEAIFIEKFRKLSHDDQMLLLDNMDSLSDSLCLTSLEKKRINKCRQLSPDDVEDIDEMIDFKLDKALRKERAIQNAAI
jgi:hypothetical protein